MLIKFSEDLNKRGFRALLLDLDAEVMSQFSRIEQS